MRIRAGEASDATRLSRNRLLSCLPPDDRTALLPHARLFNAERGTLLLAPGDPVESLLFSCGAIISLVVVMPDGRTAEAGLIGPEGLVGGASTSGPHAAFARISVLIAGDVASIDIEAIEERKQRSPALRDALARHADCFIAQLLQAIACNALHPLEKRLARWLLTVRDLQGGDELPLTQGHLSDMLGVQRTSITAAAARLQDRGLIASARGLIRIVEPEGLQAASCGCNLPVQLHYRRLLEAGLAPGGGLPA